MQDRYRIAGRQNGVSLVEVLITTLVFSVGILGISGLGAFAKRATYDTVQRSTAVELAYALFEEMRANKRAIATFTGAAVLGRGSRGAEPAPDCSAPGANCNAQEFAAHGLWAWEQMLDSGMEVSADGTSGGGLVTPTACIVGPPGSGAGVYTVTIVWRGVQELTDPAINACGAATGLYGVANEFRRMAVVRTFIDPTI